MAAPQIPHLPSLRNNREGRAPWRGRARANPEEQATNDTIVQKTDNDASVSRLSVVEVGYLHDPFAKAFVPSETDRWIRRFPIINRGTFIRTTAIDNLVWGFLSTDRSTKKQIISLGAGSDTRYFRLRTNISSQTYSFVYHELDFAENTIAKIKAITGLAKLNQCIQGPLDVATDGSALHSPTYHIHPIDLRSLTSATDTPKGRTIPENLAGVDISLPTLLISECCLCYLEPANADAALNYFSGLFPADVPLGLVVYEPFNPFDAFGEVMVLNLAARGIVLQTLHRYHSLDLQKARLRKHGFSSAEAKDVDFLWENWVSAEEKERIAGLEMVDEVEEWRLLAQHYCVVWGWRAIDDPIWKTWKELQNH